MDPTPGGSRVAPRIPDLTPDQAKRRLALIKTARNDPHADSDERGKALTWTIQDVMLVADVGAKNTVQVWESREIGFPGHVDTYREPGVPGRPMKRYPARKVLDWLIRSERLIPGTWAVSTPRMGGPGAKARMATSARTATAAWVPDLPPVLVKRRRDLIEAAQADQPGIWLVSDVALVAGVDRQTVLAWTERGIGFPRRVGVRPNPSGGRPLDEFDPGKVLKWLLRSERLIPGTWAVSTPPAGALKTPERMAAAKASPSLGRRKSGQFPAVLARVLHSTLGLERGRAGDFIIRSTVNAEGVRRYRLLVTDAGVAARVVADADLVETAAATMGHPVRITVAETGRVSGGLVPLNVEPVLPDETVRAA